MARDSGVEHEVLNLAKTVLEHPGLEKVLKRVDERMLLRFRVGDRETREQINAIMDADAAFLEELQIIVDEAASLEAEEDQSETDET